MPRAKQAHTLAREYEAAHPFPTLESCGYAGVGAVSGVLAREYNRQAFRWIMNHPVLARASGVAFATANQQFWDGATDAECDTLGRFYPAPLTEGAP